MAIDQPTSLAHIHRMPDATAELLERSSPSAVSLTRLSARMAFPSGGEALYRSVIRVAGVSPESEFLLVPSGRGKSARFIAETTGASGVGSDPDPHMVLAASERAKAKGLSPRLHFEQAPLHDLPYQDAVFDLALAEIELAGAPEPGEAVKELARVTRPGGWVVLIQLVWLGPVEPRKREDLIRRLGVRPRLVMEWKQMLRDAGVVELQVEDWASGAGPSRRLPVLDGMAELFTMRGKLRLLPRAWRRWGWAGVRAVLSREGELRRLLHDERVLGVAVIRGRVA